MTVQPLAHTNAQLSQIDELLESIDSTAEPHGALVREHLQSVRGYLLGAMPAECVSTLELAKKATAGFSDKHLRRRTNQVVTALLEEFVQTHTPEQPTQWQHQSRGIRHSEPPGKTGELSSWFAEPVTSAGVLYPTNYVIAIFPSKDRARNAVNILRAANFGSGEARLVESEEFLTFMEKLHDDEGIWGELMTRLSRAIDTEASFADKDVRLAHEGAAFVAIHCDSEQESERITAMLAPFEPIEMQWYLAGGIRSLV